MSEGAVYQPHSPSKTALTAVVLLHGAAIAALALHKMEVITIKPTVPDIFDVYTPPPPPEVPPEPVKQKVEPVQKQVVTMPPRVVEPPIERPVYQSAPVQNPPQVYAQPGPVDIVPTPPPPPPPPPPPKAKEVQPARAKANLGSYISDADYPASAVRNEEQGSTRFRLSVGPDGRVQDCAVTGSSGSSALDNATCRIMKSRARFSAARDSSGNPTGDTVTSTIRWVLPDN